VAVGTDFHSDVTVVRRPGLERVPAGADDVDFFVGRMNPGFHWQQILSMGFPAREETLRWEAVTKPV
jgi:hypothetical protein